MKKASYLIIISFLMLIVASCKDKNESPSISSSAKGTVDGASWVASTIGATYVDSVFELALRSNTGSTIMLSVLPIAGSETSKPYDLTFDSENQVGVYFEKDGDPPFSTIQFDDSKPIPGKVTFTKFDKINKKVSGTIVMDVKRESDKKVRSINLTFSEVAYATEIVPSNGQYVECNVNGVSWKAQIVETIFHQASGYVIVETNAKDKSNIDLLIKSHLNVGTYQLEDGGDVNAGYYPSGSNNFENKSGTITITENNSAKKTITGTFEFTTTKQESITSGRFHVAY